MQETQVQSIDGEDLLEKEMTTHFSMLAWEIAWKEESGGLQSVGSQELKPFGRYAHYLTRQTF